MAVKAPVKAGANAYRARQDGATALALAVLRDHADIVGCLFEERRPRTELADAGENDAAKSCAEASTRKLMWRVAAALLSLAVLEAWLSDGASPLGLKGEIGALLLSSHLDDQVKDKLSRMRAFVDRHAKVLQEHTMLKLPHVLQQLESQEPAAARGAFSDLLPAGKVKADAPKLIEWTNKPQAPQACMYTIEGAGAVYGVAYSKCGSKLARTEGKIVIAYDAVSLFEVQRFKGHTEDVSSVTWNSDATLLASGSQDKTAKVWDAATGTCVCTLKEHMDSDKGVVFHPQKRNILVSCSWDETIKICDVTLGSCLSSLSCFSGVLSIAVTGDGQHIAAETEYGVYIFSLNRQSRDYEVRSQSPLDCDSDVTSVTISLDGQHIVAGCEDGAYIFSLNQQSQRFELRSESPLSCDSEVYSIAFKDNMIAAGCKNGAIKLFALTQSGDWGEIQSQSPLSCGSRVLHIEFLSSGMLVSGDASGQTRFWSLKDIQDATKTQASVVGANFSFSKGASTKQNVGSHVITAHGDLVLVHKINCNIAKIEEDSVPVAFFRAPAQINVIETTNDQIAVGCENGDVLHLRASFLSHGTTHVANADGL